MVDIFVAQLQQPEAADDGGQFRRQYKYDSVWRK